MVETIQLNNANTAAFLGYMHKGITITPDPPQVGRTSTITLALQNTGISPITIYKIEPKIADFGIGVAWTQLPTLGPLALPVDPTAIKEVTTEWVPTEGGHHCVQAFIHTNYSVQPLCIGRNLQVINAEKTQSHWQIPFYLGNPRDRRIPVYLTLHAAAQVAAQLLVQEVLIQPGEPIWLDPWKKVDGVVLLYTQTNETIAGSIRVEATIGGRFLDGFQVEVYRPAYSPPSRYIRQDKRSMSQFQQEHVALVA